MVVKVDGSNLSLVMKWNMMAMMMMMTLMLPKGRKRRMRKRGWLL